MRIPFALFCLLVPVSALSAQQPSPSAPDSPLGVTVAAPDLWLPSGAFPAPGGAPLLPGTVAATTVVPVGLTFQETRRARKPSVVGGVVGFVLGAAAGGALGCLANEDDYGVFCGGQDDRKVYLGAALGGVVGGTLGALLLRR